MTWKCNACGSTYRDTQPDGTTYFHGCAPTPPDAQGVQHELPNRRNENILVDVRGRVLDITADGQGVTAMGSQGTSEPQWILDMRAARALAIAAGQ